MLRKIITIDEDKCTGCGLCATACHEGAIVMEKGKAKLLREDYCDGLGDCLPACEANAIRFEMREALPFDKAAVEAEMAKRREANSGMTSQCPEDPSPNIAAKKDSPSQLMQWPVQLKLAPVASGYFQDADLLVAADCTAFAHANFNQTFMRNKITLIACPKLDNTDYSEKLTAILKENSIKSLTLIRMEVPCCGGLENAAKKALLNSGKSIPLETITLGINGTIKEPEKPSA